MFFAKLTSLLALAAVSTASALAGAKTPTEDRIWISRADGSLQCDEKAAGDGDLSVRAARLQLAENGVHVIEAKKGNDGRMRAQACGISTGNETRFLIPKGEFPKAKSLGFEAAP